LDLKSGWWAGDGGSFVNKIVNSGLALPCQGKVSIEYHHLTGNGFGENSVNDQYLMAPSSPVLMQQVASFEQIFKDPTWNSYQEIWLLSGSAADHADLPVASPFFQKLVQKISASKASLFIAAGFGSISHASAISTALGIGANFSTPHPEGMILNPMLGVGLINSVSGSLLDTQHILLKGGIQSLADKVRVGPIVTYGDVIVDKGGLEIVAKDNTGAISLAVLKDKSRKVVLDANLPRYYAAWSDDQSPDTMKVLKNILVYLAQ
ncbi:MAG: hypothetical protein NTX25_05060, partial [Proteobacteria bacterium]|nr:hypothetical protein [Pseudomonadota bacterium]